ncbi:Cytochrome P453 monooxygenase [Paramyrothecium foliicola]|nr:Cytochrome P453 monooxygenase [Paramyrothecium foliicola]
MRELLKARDGGRLPDHKWPISRYDAGESTPCQLTTDQIITAFESSVSTTILCYNILFDLAVRPDLQDELRQEIAENTMSGQFPPTNLEELRKMDSLMRETFRISPFALCKYQARLSPHSLLAQASVQTHYINK